MDTMEEGELLSSDNDDSNPPPSKFDNSAEISFHDDILDDSNYVIIQRPKSSLPRPSGILETDVTSESSTQKHQQTRDPCQISGPGSTHQLDQNVNTIGGNYGVLNGGYEEFGRRGYYNKAGVSDLLDSSDKESSSASDSDDDHLNGKRSRMAMPSGNQYSYHQGSNQASGTNVGGESSISGCPAWNDSSAQQQQGGLTDFFAQAAKFQKERKPNLVWSNVIQEEEISKCLGHQARVGGGLAEVEVNRGPETYFFQRPMRKPRQRRASDSSDISSEGLSDNALHYLKDGMVYDNEDAEEPSAHSLPTSFKSSSVHSKKASKRRRNSNKHKNKITQKLKKMKSGDLAVYMAKKLKEEKSQLLTRAIETLGKDACIRVFLKTLKIEKRGGIMVKSQERRRTAGGVFLYLIRGDRRFPKSSVDIIFREERAYTDKFRKKKIASKRLRKKEELEAAKAALEQGNKSKITTSADDMMKLDNSDQSESQSDYTATANDQQDGTTDTGHFGDDSTQESSVHSRDTAAEELSGFVGMQCDGSS